MLFWEARSSAIALSVGLSDRRRIRDVACYWPDIYTVADRPVEKLRCRIPRMSQAYEDADFHRSVMRETLLWPLKDEGRRQLPPPDRYPARWFA